MKAKTLTLTRAERRHRTAIRRSARIGGSLAKLVRAALRSCVEAMPERPGPADLLRMRSHVEGVVRLLGPVVGDRLRRMLKDAAEREHLLSAVQLTRAANGSRGELAGVAPDGWPDRRPVGGGGNVGGVRVGEAVIVREDWRDYLRLLVPPPALEFLERVVGTAWRALTRIIDPQRASNVVLQGVAAGKDRKQIAKDLEVVFGGFESSARRVARTEGARVALATQLHVSEQVPELVIGYELNTVLDDRVRPEHRKMHGVKFYREPKGNQRGLDQCPRPPIWDSTLHYNCRCFLVPIVAIDGEEV